MIEVLGYGKPSLESILKQISRRARRLEEYCAGQRECLVAPQVGADKKFWGKPPKSGSVQARRRKAPESHCSKKSSRFRSSIRSLPVWQLSDEEECLLD